MDAEVEVEITVEILVELETTLVVLGVVDEIDEVDVDVDVTVGDVIETLTGIEVVEAEIGIELEIDIDVESVLREVLSVTATDDGVLELKFPVNFMVRMKNLEMLTQWGSLSTDPAV